MKQNVRCYSKDLSVRLLFEGTRETLSLLVLLQVLQVIVALLFALPILLPLCTWDSDQHSKVNKHTTLGVWYAFFI